MSGEKYDAIVIGAGVTGLACAYQLVRQGKKVLVCEARDELGGLLSSYTFETFTIERYYHHFFTYDAHLLRSIGQLGLETEVDWKKASTGYYYQGEIYNLDTPREIFLYRHLSLKDKFLLSLAVLKIKRLKDFRALDKVTARDWLLHNTSSGVYHNFFAPLLKSKFGSAADQISAAWLCARLKLRSNRKMSGEQLGYFKHGFETYLLALKGAIEQSGSILTGHSVTRIDHDTQGIQGVFVGDDHFSARTVVSTIAPTFLLPLADFSETYRQKLQLNKSQSVVCALLGMKEPLLKTYWLNIRSESLPFALLIEHTNFHEIPEYQGHKILYVATYLDGPDDPFYQLPDSEIIHSFQKGLTEEFGLSSQNVVWHKLSKAPAVGPIYTVNFLDNLLPHETGIPGLFVGGMMTSYPERGINASVDQGELCAKLVNSFLTQVEPQG